MICAAIAKKVIFRIYQVRWLSNFVWEINRLWSDCSDEQSDHSLFISHTNFSTLPNIFYEGPRPRPGSCADSFVYAARYLFSGGVLLFCCWKRRYFLSNVNRLICWYTIIQHKWEYSYCFLFVVCKFFCLIAYPLYRGSPDGRVLGF